MGGTNNSNNSAFPIPALPARNMDPGASYSPDTGWIHAGSYGLTKREYYAGLAPASEVQAIRTDGIGWRGLQHGKVNCSIWEARVIWADALLKALEGPQ